MARGLARFEGSLLLGLRQGAITGKRMTAQQVADRIGATKAQILAYEAGRVTPEPHRIKALADVFQVPSLYLCGGGAEGIETIADLRRACGYNAKEVACALRLSAKSYRRFELEGIVPRRRFTLPDELADFLHIRSALLERVLLLSPGVEARTRRIQEIFDALHDRYAMTNTVWTPPDATDDLVVELTELVSRSQLMVLKIVRDVLHRERVARLRIFELELNASLHPDPDRRSTAAANVMRRRRAQSRFGTRMGAELEPFFRQALPRDVVDLMLRLAEPGLNISLGWIPRSVLADVPPRLLMPIADDAEPESHVELSPEGLRHLHKFHQWYGVIYPRLKFPDQVRYPWRARRAVS